MYKFELKVLPQQQFRINGAPVPFGAPVDNQEIEQGQFSYREYLLTILSRNQQGMDLAEMRKAMDVLRKLEHAQDGETLDFENVEFEWIRQSFSQVKFGAVLEQLLQLADDLDRTGKE
jgi:hypothetical protein